MTLRVLSARSSRRRCFRSSIFIGCSRARRLASLAHVARAVAADDGSSNVGQQGGRHERWAQQDTTTGQWNVQGHAAHKVSSANVYRLDEIQEIYRCISAPVLSVQASDDSLNLWWKGSYTLADYFKRLSHVPQAQTATLPDTGHMLHHDQPEALAQLVSSFLTDVSQLTY